MAITNFKIKKLNKKLFYIFNINISIYIKMEIQNSYGKIEHDSNGLPIGIDPIMSMLCMEYNKGNINEFTENYYVDYVRNMLSEYGYNKQFIEKTRELFKNASTLEDNLEELQLKEDEEEKCALKDYNAYKGKKYCYFNDDRDQFEK